jgi:hypothetical protein
MMEREIEALKGSPLEFARFLNFYGNFLGLASGTIEASSADVALDRKPLYGFADVMPFAKRGESWVSEMKRALKEGSSMWNEKLSRFGSTLGYSTDISVQVKVKAIREVVPALENAKNIIFAQELGLRLPLDPVRSALPAANEGQRARYAGLVQAQARSAKLDWEALRVIASHQYPGVRFARQAIAHQDLTLDAPLTAISLGGSYNQTQQ